jgi:signal peptidase I
MRHFQPTQTQQKSSPEGGYELPLRLRDEKRSVIHGAGTTTKSQASSLRIRIIEPPAPWWRRHLFVLVCVALFSVPAYFLASRFIVTAVVVQGRSMTPTLKDGERYYLNRWRYLLLSPRRGDVVVIKDPGHGDYAVKRIIARPYDWLNLRDGKIYINGKRLDEPYLDKGVRTDTPDLKERWIQLGRDQYYVLGDNRGNSEDSRFYGIVPGKNIIGMIIK